jgi:hypothetical protein
MHQKIVAAGAALLRACCHVEMSIENLSSRNIAPSPAGDDLGPSRTLLSFLI